jgi:CHAD domain-containing protein
MSYGLSFDDDPAGSVEQVRREQLEAAAEILDAGEDPVEAIHDARKRIKKTRALLRLARPGMKPKAYRRLNRELRDTGRGMSGSRDADVLVETVEDLAERFGSRAPKTFFAGVRQPLATHAQALRKDADATCHVAALRGLAEDEWPLRGLDADALTEALQRTYARGRKAFVRADREPTTTNLHEWRKRVKDLWYQQRLLADTWPGVMKAQAKEAKTLSKLLGEDHDLAVLAEHVADDQLHAMIDTRRAELLAQSRDLGRRIYAEQPKAFARRSRRYVELAA